MKLVIAIAFTIASFSASTSHSLGLQCSKIFASNIAITSQSSIREWAHGYNNLKVRLIEAVAQKRTLGRSHEQQMTDLNVPLLQNEKTMFLEANLSVLQTALNSKFVKRLDKKNPGTLKIQNMATELRAQFQDWKKTETTVTYLEIMNSTYKMMLFIDRLESWSTGGRSRTSEFVVEDAKRGYNDTPEKIYSFDASIMNAVRAGLLPVFTQRELSIRDFNSLLGTSIAPIAMSPVTVRADQNYIRPLALLIHDANHASGPMAHVDPRIWKQTLSVVEKWTPHEQMGAHVIIFAITHENPGLFQGSFRYSSRLWSSLEFRLGKEDWWGERGLENIPDLKNYLNGVGEKLDTVLEGFRRAEQENLTNIPKASGG